MSLLQDNGYLGRPYLNGDSYLGGDAQNGQNLQIHRVINSASKTKNIQVRGQIATLSSNKIQVKRAITNNFAKNIQILLFISKSRIKAVQVLRIIAPASRSLAFQVLRTVTASTTKLIQINLRIEIIRNNLFQMLRVVTPSGGPRLVQILRQVTTSVSAKFQVLRLITNFSLPRALQVLRDLSVAPSRYIQTKRGRILHTINVDSGYLGGSYLVDNYLVRGTLAWLPVQVARGINTTHNMRFQIEKIIVDYPHTAKGQVERVINAVHRVGFQINRIQQFPVLVQVNRILYNTKRLRVLLDFPSRGTTGTNWTATHTASGDFSPSNLNTDIVEQCWRSDGAKVVSLTCDTQVSQGVFVDTIGLLGHNLTRSSTVEVQASMSPSFATYTSFFMASNRTSNWYYVAPKAPTSSYRYWRFVISDTTNTAAFLQIGTIVFGSSIIMVANDIIDSVKRSTKHFADKISTEGFTSVTNDRAIKYGLGVAFESITYDSDDYTSIRRLFDTARTSLKCLWIPTPEYPERFAVFGKLSEIPEEEHNALGPANDYVNFNVDVDESL